VLSAHEWQMWRYAVAPFVLQIRGEETSVSQRLPFPWSIEFSRCWQRSSRCRFFTAQSLLPR
jgi:hypothetical protein